MSNPLFQFLGDNNLVEVAVITMILFMYRSIRKSLLVDQLRFETDIDRQRLDTMSKYIDRKFETINDRFDKQSEKFEREIDRVSDKIDSRL